MLTFQIVLTANQIRTLREHVQIADFMTSIGLDPNNSRDYMRVSEKDENWQTYKGIWWDNKHIIGGIRMLIREGMMRNLEPTGHVVTEKGRLVLRLVEMDIEDFQKVVKPEEKAKGKKKAEPSRN